MARNSKVAALRAEAKRLERNATKKMSRLRNGANGVKVELKGTQYDLRKGASTISSMRSRDLEVHIRRLTEFNNRRSRFIGTDRGVAGPEIANRLFSAQTKLNNQRKAMLEKYGNIKVALSDETIAQSWAKREPAQRHMADPTSNNPFREVDKRGMKYKTPEAIIKMAELFEKKVKPEHQAEERQSNRVTLDKMLDMVNAEELKQMVKQMTDEQFDLMWSDPDFMANQGFVYAQIAGREPGVMDKDMLETFEDSIENGIWESTQIAKWALSQ